jgi:hypothetical protein
MADPFSSHLAKLLLGGGKSAQMPLLNGLIPKLRLPDLDLRRVKERRWVEGLINRAAGRGGAVKE